MFSSVMADTGIVSSSNTSCVSNTTLRNYNIKNVTLDGNTTTYTKSYDTICNNGCSNDSCNMSQFWTIIISISVILGVLLLMGLLTMVR
jgi:hypothetical protein